MSEQTWPEFIKEHIEHTMWKGGQVERRVARVMDEVTVWVMEDDKLPDLLWAVTGKLSDDIGYMLQVLVDKNLSYYCDQKEDDLKDIFPEVWDEYREENGIAENAFPCGKMTGDEQ